MFFCRDRCIPPHTHTPHPAMLYSTIPPCLTARPPFCCAISNIHDTTTATTMTTPTTTTITPTPPPPPHNQKSWEGHQIQCIQVARALHGALGARGFRLLLPDLLPLLLGTLKVERENHQPGGERPGSIAVMRLLAAVKVRGACTVETDATTAVGEPFFFFWPWVSDS